MQEKKTKSEVISSDTLCFAINAIVILHKWSGPQIVSKLICLPINLLLENQFKRYTSIFIYFFFLKLFNNYNCYESFILQNIILVQQKRFQVCTVASKNV